MHLLARSTFLRITLAVALCGCPVMLHASPPDADAVMAHARSQAAAEHKNILIAFGASWCGNCRLFDRFLADPSIHPIMDKAFIFVDLNTGERENDPKHANIPGGQKLQASLGGKEAGYPYIAMVDPAGSLLADSTRPASLGHGGNIGYPDASYEIDWFVEMLKKGAPALSAQETASIRNWLTAHSSHH